MGGLSRWLDVEVGTDEIILDTLPSNVTLVDLNNDNEFKLIIGDLGRDDDGPRVKIFKGAILISDFGIPDLPLGVVAFYSSETNPPVSPLLAVAFSSCMYVYRGMTLFYKYYLPSIELNPKEIEVWEQLLDMGNHKEENITRIIEGLKKIPEKILSNQSKDFLILNIEQQIEYLETCKDMPQKRYADIACVAILKMNSVDKYAVSCLVVGSEEGDIIILDPQTFSQLSSVKLCSIKRTPYQIVATGLFHVDYRLTVATREKCVCVVKRDWSEGRILFCTDDHITAIEVLTTDNTIMVICADNTLACYSRKGRKQWCTPLEQKPVAMCLVPVMHLGVTLTAVALASGHLHLYDGKTKRDSIFIRDVVSVMKFGQLGQEEHVFAIITANGNLMLKILKRTADFSSNYSVEVGSGVQKPWLIPKKSKLFLEQAARERDNAHAMHTSFQLELSRLRLQASKTLLEAHARCDNNVARGDFEPIRLSAEVEGFGPIFTVSLIVENTSPDKAVIGLYILFHVYSTNYKVRNPYIKVPLLAPGNKLKFPTQVEELFDDNLSPDVFFRPVTGRAGEGATLKVLLLKQGRRSPVLAATVQMPPTDPMMVPYEKIQATAAFRQVEHDQ